MERDRVRERESEAIYGERQSMGETLQRERAGGG